MSSVSSLEFESPCIYVAFSMQARSTGIPDGVKCGDFTHLLPPGDGVVERVGCYRALQAENVENYETLHSLGGICYKAFQKIHFLGSLITYLRSSPSLITLSSLSLLSWTSG